ncbi:hypothetical protein RUM44_011370 [Polyplax serrata]|uniref:C2H2-type domain-containing protein n=1 Tax=Polyplax serrata TaxID=468196 RepID=A0ABR1APY3_POLSC
MNHNKKGCKISNLKCSLCNIIFNSEAEHALHEFSKKHCDNLIKLARNKPVTVKPKPKTGTETLQNETEMTKTEIVTQPGSIAKYGYFVPGEISVSPNVTKEYNTEYDPYQQKFPEKSLKETTTPIVTDTGSGKTTETRALNMLSKEKRKKTQVCQICHVTLTSVPEYNSHMKSPQHIWHLKMSGKGVGAHFVRASVDLHTTEFGEESVQNQGNEEPIVEPQVSITPCNSTEVFPSLFCDTCELLLNSPQQFNAHVNGKSHVERTQKIAELKAKKEKLQNPTTNQLYCFSCKITLNNIVQYNQHKNGKKHSSRCLQLIKGGITIPPEERLPGWIMPNSINNKPITYPELYEKYLKKKQEENGLCSSNSSEPLKDERIMLNKVRESLTENSSSSKEILFSSDSDHMMSFDKNSISVISKFMNNNTSHDLLDAVGSGNSSQSQLNHPTNTNSEVIMTPKSECGISSNVTKLSNSFQPKYEERQLLIVGSNEFVKCNVCSLNFISNAELNSHMTAEIHLNKILEHKMNGTNDIEILNLMLSTQDFMKPDNLGRCNCYICDVVTNDVKEYRHHLNNIVHVHNLNDYKQRKMTEIRSLVSSNKEGVHPCHLCQEDFKSLLDFCQHLHMAKHKICEQTEKSKRALAKRKLDQKEKEQFNTKKKRKKQSRNITNEQI